MRKIAALVVTAAATLGLGAGTASADVTNAQYSVVNYGPKKLFTCNTPLSNGVFGQYGAWGDYMDGCTVQLFCPPTSVKCTAWEGTSISAYGAPAVRVTQNARLRVINASSGAVVWFRDRSCSGTSSCGNSDSVQLSPGQYASVQCNGVRQHIAGAPWASNSCSVRMDYE
jgi:hypothetical protein